MNDSTISVHVWDRSFLLRARSFSLSKHSKPYRRPSATVLIAERAPFLLKTNHGARRQYQAALVAPFVLRQSLVAEDSGLTIVDAGITSEAYRRLQPRLPPQQVLELGGAELEQLQARVLGAGTEPDCDEARRIFDGVVDVLAGSHQASPLSELLTWMEQAAPGQPAENQLAERLGISVRRLRRHFSDAVGCAPTQLQHWMDAWRVLQAWRPGLSLPRLAQQAGLADLAAMETAVQQLFGLGSVAILGSGRLRFHNCNSC